MNKIGLVLGGGGAKATIYIGFYEVLYENNIEISYISGTSMGAIIGAAIAMKMPPQTLKEHFLKIKDYNLTSITNFNFFNESLFKRDKFDELLKNLCGDIQIENMTTPFCCTAVDLEQKKEVIFTQGSLFEALRASSAYPPILSPIFYQDKYLVDGGIIDNVPAIAARQMEKTHSIDNGKIVAFKINNNIIRQHIAGHIFIKHYRKPSFLERFNIFKRKMEDLKLLGDLIMEIVTIASEQHVIKNLAQAKPEILFEPIIDVGLTNFSQLEPQIALGRKIALDNLEKIKNLQLSNQTI